MVFSFFFFLSSPLCAWLIIFFYFVFLAITNPNSSRWWPFPFFYLSFPHFLLNISQVSTMCQENNVPCGTCPLFFHIWVVNFISDTDQQQKQIWFVNFDFFFRAGLDLRFHLVQGFSNSSESLCGSPCYVIKIRKICRVPKPLKIGDFSF